MSEIQYLDYTGLQHYHELLQVQLADKADKTEIPDTDHTVTVKSGKKADGTTDITATSVSAENPVVTLGNSGVTANGYGDTTAQTPAYGATFKVPYIKVNAQGIVTDASEHTVTIPSATQNTTGIKLGTGTVSGTKKTDSTVIKADSSTGLTIYGGENKFSIGDGTNYIEVEVSPSIANNVTGSGLTADNIVLGNGSSAVKTSSKTIATSLGNDDSTIPTSGAVQSAFGSYMPKSGGTFTGVVTLNADPTANLHAATKQYVDNQISTKIAAADAMVFKGTLGTGGTVTALPTSGVVVGDTYKVITAGTYASQAAKIGDLFIATATTPTWAYVPSGDEIVTTIQTGTSNIDGTAKSGTVIVGTAATKAFETSLTDGGNLPTGAAVKAFVEGKGYVTSSGITSITGQKGVVATTSNGTTTVKASLKNETANAEDSSKSSATGGLYSVELDKSGYLAVNVPSIPNSKIDALFA